MKRLIHAMAALGAALVFGCAGAPETPDDATDIAAGSASDGSDIGQSSEALIDCQYMGIEIKPTGEVTANACWSTFAHEPYYCGISSLYGNAGGVKWAWDPATNINACASHAEPTGFGPFEDVTAITAGINAWQSATDMTFSFTTNAASADILIGCATAGAQAAGDETWATTGPAGTNNIGQDILGTWGTTFKPPGATNPQFGVRIKQHKIIIHDATIISHLDTCPGAVTGTARLNNQHRFMANLVAHEVGHAMGFGDYSSLGLMSLRMDQCNQPATVTIPPALAAAASSVHDRYSTPAGPAPGSPNLSPCQNVPVPLQGGSSAVSLNGNGSSQYASLVRDMIESGAWDSSTVDGNTFHGPTLSPAGGTMTPDVTNGAVGTHLSLPPTDYGVTPAIGSKIAYTDNMTFGIQTGSSHLSCNWSSTTQQCAFPHSYVFDWCFGANVQDAQFKADFRTYSGLDAAQGSWNILGDYGHATWRFHNSCNDAGVNLVVDTAACSGSNSANIDGYVCLGMPTMTAPESIINDSGFTAPGTYYNWQKQPLTNTWMTLHIDTSDISARVGTSTDRTNLFKHAVHIGLLWTRGIGSRTDVADLMSSRAVLPYVKVKRSFSNPENTLVSEFAHMSPGEYCRSFYNSWPTAFIASYPAGTTYITRYCGAD